MKELDFLTVDVFTDQQFGGNPLAVVLNADGLTTQQMQSIAAEFNLSETTFVLPPKDPSNTAEVRIFVPKAELPFAGHPNIGTAFALSRIGTVYGKPLDPNVLAFEEKAGLVRLEIARDTGDVSGAKLTAPQQFAMGEVFGRAGVAQACSLEEADIIVTRHEPCIGSCGTPFLLTELASLEALARARPNMDGSEKLFAQGANTGILVYVRTPGEQDDIRARMFAPLKGIPEDPATGSANVALSGLTAHLDPAADLDLSLRIVQGVEMGRPSLMLANATKRGGQVTQTTIAGTCVPMMSGTLRLE